MNIDVKNKNILNRFESRDFSFNLKKYKVHLMCGKSITMISMAGLDKNSASKHAKDVFLGRFSHVETC